MDLDRIYKAANTENHAAGLQAVYEAGRNAGLTEAAERITANGDAMAAAELMNETSGADDQTAAMKAEMAGMEKVIDDQAAQIAHLQAELEAAKAAGQPAEPTPAPTGETGQG